MRAFFKTSIAITILVLVGGLSSAFGVTASSIEDSLMSPGCNYRFTVTNCPSSLGYEMKLEIRKMVDAGNTREQIVSHFVTQYGERVLAAPPKRGFNILAWTLPFIGLGLGMVGIGIVIYSWSRREMAGGEGETTTPITEDEDEYAKRLQKEIEEYDS